jgi:murein L,D-transpeptidase YcbB/YkuD
MNPPWCALILWLSLLPSVVCAAAPATLSSLLAGDAPQVTIANTRLWSTPVLRRLYTDDLPRWTEERIDALRAAIAHTSTDGLDPQDFLAAQLEMKLPPAERELLASEALARVAFTLRYGKANPLALDPNWNYSRTFGTTNPALWLHETITRGDLGTQLQSLRPPGRYYAALTTALAEHRALQARGSWPLVPAGDTLKPGMVDPRVPLLRARLTASGEFAQPVAPQENTIYDAPLIAAVEAFQQRHGLAVDGAVGRGTLAALNVPLATRIDQIRINLERLRWVFRDLGEEYVAVNIAGYQAVYFRDGEVRWRGRAIVGRPYRQTPIFRDELSYLELNPTWTVPPTILREDILPKLRQNPAYLREKKLRVVDPNGGAVSASNIDWRRVSATNFRYFLRQDPGPDNALGRIKFMFPNAHAVYLHDTPARELFAQPERSFSSGCIRIEQPLDLAVELLDDPQRWNLATLNAALDTRRTQRVNLPSRVPIMLLYLTVFPDETGHLQFRRDIYSRDSGVLQALNGALTWTPPADFTGSF